MIHSQICLLYYDYRFKYHIEYQDDVQNASATYLYSSSREVEGDSNNIENDRLFIRKGSNNIYKRGNIWKNLSVDSGKEIYNNGNVINVNESSINLYFPEYAIETYIANPDYSISIYTYINGVRVQLGSYRINRREVLATDKKVKFKNVDYKEFINLKFPDPWYICYSDTWKQWRDDILGVETDEINNEGSTIYIELSPLEKYFDEEYREDCWRVLTNYSSGSCSIPFTTNVDDLMHLDCKPMIVEAQGPTIITNLSFNKVYKGDLLTYLHETYRLDIPNEETLNTWKTQFILLLGDDKGPYSGVNSGWIKTCSYVPVEYRKDKDNNYILDKNGNKIVKKKAHFLINNSFSKDDLGIKGWEGWRPGLMLKGVFNLLNDRDEEIISVTSKPFPMTMENFKYFIETKLDTNKIEFLNLDYIHMQSYNVEVVNKINKQVIKVSKPDDYKANILKPIFVRTYESSLIKVHPDVTESICIDLNILKNKVTTFFLKIEGKEFIESGRTSAGVIFKINGNTLPNKKTNGTYYILNEDHDLVTSGNYTYIQ